MQYIGYSSKLPKQGYKNNTSSNEVGALKYRIAQLGDIHCHRFFSISFNCNKSRKTLITTETIPRA